MAEAWSYSLGFRGEEIELGERRLTVGRSRACDVSIKDPSVSRRHAELTPLGARIVVRDLGSSNGTFINGQRVVETGELVDGDTLGLGDASLEVRVESPRASEPAPPPAAEPPAGRMGEATSILQAESMRLAQEALDEAAAEPVPAPPAAAAPPGAHMAPLPPSPGHEPEPPPSPAAQPPSPSPMATVQLPAVGGEPAGGEVRSPLATMVLPALEETDAPPAEPEPDTEDVDLAEPMKDIRQAALGIEPLPPPSGGKGEILPSLDGFDTTLGPGVPVPESMRRAQESLAKAREAQEEAGDSLASLYRRPEPLSGESSRARQPPRWARTAGALGGVFLGGVLLVAAWAKALDPAAFAEQIAGEGLDFLLPAGTMAIFALALEVALGSALVLLIRRRWNLWPTAALVVFFLFLTGRAYLRHLQGLAPADGASCGCFGNLVQRTPAQAFWGDMLLMVPALLLAFVARGRGSGWPRRRLAAVAVATVAAVVFAWKAPQLPLDDLATRLRPGVDPAALCAGPATDGLEVCLDGILPELADGEHVVILADVTAEAFGGGVERLNEYHRAGSGPSLWVLTGNTGEELFGFRFGKGPAFELRETPPALLRPLYRTLPRSFLVRGGRVVETWSGLPPLDELAGEAPAGT